MEVIDSAGMLHATYLLIGSIAEGEEARSQNPDVALMPMISSEAEVRAYLDALSPIIMFEIEYEDATPEVVDLIHSYDIKIHMDALGLYDVQGIAGYNTLLAGGTDSIQTDRLELLVPFLRGLPSVGRTEKRSSLPKIFRNAVITASRPCDLASAYFYIRVG